MAQTFYPIDPVEVTPGTASAWTDVNGADFGVPSGATGIIAHLINNGAGALAVGLRNNGSTDNRTQSLYSYTHCWAAIGVDADRKFEAYVGSITQIDIYIVGYTMSGVTFFINAVTPFTTLGAWTDFDYSPYAPNAIGLIFEVNSTSTPYGMGLRNDGSTDNRINQISDHNSFGMIIGCSASQICEGYTTYISQQFRLVGYIIDGATFNINATDVSLGTVGSWLDLAALPANSVMGFIEEVCPSGGFNATYGLRKNGSAENQAWWQYWHPWAFVECDANYIIEGRIESLNQDFFVVGYATKPVAVELGAFYQQLSPLGFNVYRAGQVRGG